MLSITQTIKQSAQFFFKHPFQIAFLALGIFIANVIISLVSEFAPLLVNGFGEVVYGIVYAISFIISLVLMWLLQLGWVNALWGMVRENRGVHLDDITSVGTHWLRIIGVNALLMIVLTVGFLLLIIPGIYLSLRYSQVFYGVLEGKGVLESFKYSAMLTRGYKLKILGIYLSIFLMLIAIACIATVLALMNILPILAISLGALAFIIISLMFNPIYAFIYERLKFLSTTPAAHGDSRE